MPEIRRNFGAGHPEREGFREFIPLRVPGEINPETAKFNILTTIKNPNFRFHSKEVDPGKQQTSIIPLITESLLLGKTLEFRIAGQRMGDIVVVSWAGLAKDTAESRSQTLLYQFTNNGWRESFEGIEIPLSGKF